MARPTVKRIIFSLALTTVVILPILWIAAPAVHRWAKLRHLNSDDSALRQPALVYVARHAATDPAVRDDAIGHLDDPDDDVFNALVYALDTAKQWRRPTIPDVAWLRWIRRLAGDPDPTGRIYAAQQTGQLRDLANDQRVEKILATLLSDKDADVRMNALIATAELAKVAGATTSWHGLLSFATQDENAQVARQAWLLGGLLTVVQPTEEELLAMPPYVAQAAAWAASQHERDEPRLAASVVRDAATPMAMRAAVAGALIGRRRVEQPPAAVGPPGNAAEQTLIWRLLLADVAQAPIQADERRLLRGYLTAAGDASDAATLEAVLPWACVAAHRLGETVELPAFASPMATHLLTLAAIESPVPSRDVTSVDDDAAELIRLLAVRRQPHVTADALLPFMASDTPTVRELACVVAVERLDEADIGKLITRSLTAYDDQAKMAGALLAGLSNVRPTRPILGDTASSGQPATVDLLESRMAAEDVWAVRQVMRLGLWMQGRLPAMDATTSNLLSRQDIPRTHVLLAMLHRGDRTAFDVLFAPRGEPGMDLLHLLVAERWWYVLHRALPANAPTLTLWADDDWQRMEIAILRNWYLLTQAKPVTTATR